MNRSLALMLLGWFLAVPTLLNAQSPPNIVFILADDLAWSDLACYGHPYHHTPHLDRLSRDGMQFTQAYASAPICSASRASILTGKSTALLGFEFVTKDKPGRQPIDADVPLEAPPYKLDLPLEEITLAERLDQRGYETAFFGKWHVSQHYQRYLGWSPTHGPLSQGFEVAEEDVGSHPYSWRKHPPKSISEDGQFADDSMVDRVCRFILKAHDRPFFVMASNFYVHTPVKTPHRWLTDKYEELVPEDSLAKEKRIRYGAFVETLDHLVGQIINAVDQTAERDNTLIVFTSDNGGHPEFAANGPLRGSKWNLYEGGIRVPLIVRWPQQIDAGRSSDAPVIGYDLHPTFADLAGEAVSGLDGVSLGSLLKQGILPSERDLIWHFPYYHPEKGFAKAPEGIGVSDFVTSRTRPQSALRRGTFKLLYFHEDNSHQLYDLSQDPSEQVDLSAQKPQVAARLSAALRDYLARVDARMPRPK